MRNSIFTDVPCEAVWGSPDMDGLGNVVDGAWGRPSHPMAKFLLLRHSRLNVIALLHSVLASPKGHDLNASIAFSFISLLFKSRRTWGRYLAVDTPHTPALTQTARDLLGNFYRTLPVNRSVPSHQQPSRCHTHADQLAPGPPAGTFSLACSNKQSSQNISLLDTQKNPFHAKRFVTSSAFVRRPRLSRKQPQG